MSELSTNELIDATVKENLGGPDTYVVELASGDVELVPKTGKNTILLKDDFDLDADARAVGSVVVEFDFESDDYDIVYDGTEVHVPPEKHENVLWALYDRDEPRLKRLHDELNVPTVREGMMDWFRPRFDVEIEKVENGWLVGGDVLVRWDGTNRVANVDEVHVRDGSTTVPADEEKPALDLTVNTDDVDAEAPHGQTVDLDAVEVRFLTTVAHLSDDYGDYGDGLSAAVDGSSVNGYTAPTSGLYHGHDRQKHDLADLGVTEAAIDRLWTERDDHAGVWEMAVREDEFRDAPFDVFESAPNDSEKMWNKIHTTKEKAPIPSEFHRRLEQRYDE